MFGGPYRVRAYAVARYRRPLSRVYYLYAAAHPNNNKPPGLGAEGGGTGWLGVPSRLGPPSK